MEEVSKKEIMENLNISEGKVKHALSDLKQEERIVSVGRNRSTRYIIKQ